MSSQERNTESASFGRVAQSVRTAQELLDLEHEQGLSEMFADLDSLLGRRVVRALKGDRLISVGGHPAAPTLELEDTTRREREMLDELFSLDGQRSRGAWWLPEQVSARCGVIHFWAIFRECARFAHNFAIEERYNVAVEDSPEAVFIHTVLNPLFLALYEPFSLRGEVAGKLKKDSEITRWDAAVRFFEDLHFDVAEVLLTMRYGRGWSKLTSSGRLEAKRRLSDALAEQVESKVAARYRAHHLLALIERYYSKADSEGRAVASKVLTRGLELRVSGFFGGGWLRVLDYLGEKPHPEEQVVTTLPDIKLLIRPKKQARKAVDTGTLGRIDKEQLDLIVASLYGSEESPVERRIRVLRKLWETLDDLDIRPTSNVAYLWGHIFPRDLYSEGYGVSKPSLLPESLQHEIKELWGTVMFPRFPDRMVSEPFPYERITDALGEEGFKRLRDNSNQRRRAWTEEHLDKYLIARAEAALRETATAYNIATEQRHGKPPTPRQFAEVAERATNLWFGGHIANLYRAFGEKPPFEVVYSRLLPNDIKSFVVDVYRALGGEQLPLAPQPRFLVTSPSELEAYKERRRHYAAKENRERDRARLAIKATEYIQLAEALGRSPTFKEFKKFTSPSLESSLASSLNQDAAEAYPAYTRIVEQAVRSCSARK